MDQRMENPSEYASINKQGSAGQLCVLGHIKHIQHVHHIQHIQQCQSWTPPIIFIKKIVHFQHKKRLPSDGRTNERTDGRTD